MNHKAKKRNLIIDSYERQIIKQRATEEVHEAEKDVELLD